MDFLPNLQTTTMKITLMKLKIPLAFAALALLLTGCWQKSLHAFYKENQLTYDAALLGEWREPDKAPEDATTWSFSKGAATNVYNLRVEDKETKLDFEVRMFKMGEQRFLDLHSSRRSISEIPAHHLFRVREIEPMLKIDIMDIEWVQNWIREHRNDIPAIQIMDPEHPGDADEAEFVLTADTERLQKFVRDHMKAEGFFKPAEPMKKLNTKL
jgi:hypothetical protein